MNATQFYIAISIMTLAAVAALYYSLTRRGLRKITPLTSLGFAFILAGLMFGENREIGYGLLAIGVILAVTDLIRKQARKKPGGPRR